MSISPLKEARECQRMVQKMAGLGLAGVGIVPTMFIIGVILVVTKIATMLGYVAIIGSVLIGLTLGALGAAGVMRRVL
jgi:hypothetical protein